MEMRDLRNRVVHDYLPEEIKRLYDLIMEDYKDELRRVIKKIEGIEKALDR